MQAPRTAARLFVLGAALFFSWAALAHAADNIVPNPSFETGCTIGGIPTSWEVAFSGPVCSPTAKTGSWGLQVTVAFDGQGVYSTCVNRALSGPYPASFAYSTTDTNVARATLRAIFYGSPDCNSSIFFQHSTLSDTTITTGGAFETVSGTLTARAGTQSVKFAVEVGCPTTSDGITCTPDSATAIFDDVFFDAAAPLAATVRGFSAARTAKGTLVRWTTASDAGLVGFRVYRELSGRRVAASQRLIRARGASAGERYSFLDRTARRPPRARYWLQVVRVDGSRSWYGPAHIEAEAARAA